eukprot:CAMPEP_0117474374 /NCGR_PEP_ID=MMETSP0784-20121206/9251_1 /TAXON_ID=39447 /ORGANISM="" /LENGTH=612 /DNA_ID=CAMNT_0005268597 /DNA_START=42 /DNA_END=1880 /DNA_ORIENTATION=+
MAAGADGPQIAPLVSLESLAEVHVSELDSGPVSYVVQCVSGRFAGRFIYVNRRGELFGSDSECKDVTMAINDAGLSAKHACLTFDQNTYQYFLFDVGSEDGTWLQIRQNRSIEVDVGQEIVAGRMMIELVEGPCIAEGCEVAHWLAAYQLQHLAPKLREQGVTSLDDVRSRREQIIDMESGSVDEAEDLSVLTLAINELDRMFPPKEYPKHSILVQVRPRDGSLPVQTICEVSWAGGFIALAPGADVLGDVAGGELPLGVVVTGSGTHELLRLGYGFGKYYVHLRDAQAFEEPSQAWVRLRAEQRHWLRPQDSFRIGSLQFQIQRFNTGIGAEQGSRPSMEDEDIAMQDFPMSNWRYCSYFGVYDGHGGRDCVEFIHKNLHINFLEALKAKGGLDHSSRVFHDIYEGLVESFLETDRHYLRLVKEGVLSNECGSAAVVACIVGGCVFCANCGDSRALLCREGRAIQLSLDHKPDRSDELERIKEAGGFVTWGRVMGRLALSRAFGDSDCKAVLDGPNGEARAIVVAVPEIRIEQLTPQDEFMLLGCDGLFDVFSSQEVVDFVRHRLAGMPPYEQDPRKAVQDLVHEAIHERYSRDNVTAIIVAFKPCIIVET